MQLYKHQQLAKNASVPVLVNPGSRATISMACGTGKTLTSIRIAEDVMANTPNAKIVVFVPTLPLSDQLMTNWSRYSFNGQFTMLPVGSAGSSLSGKQSGATIVLANTTDSKEIANALQTKGRLIVFCTYQSAGSIKNAVSKLLSQGIKFSFDFAVMDEAHRTAGGGKDEDSSYLMCLSDNLIPIKRRLFITATPRVRRMSDTAQGTEALKEQFRDYGHSMNDKNIYGDVVFKYSFAEAITEKMLADYRICVVMISNEDIRSAALMDSRIDLTGVNMKNPSKKDLKKLASAKNLAVTAALSRMFIKGMVQGVLTFHQDRENSMLFADNATTFLRHSSNRRLSDAHVAHVDGNTPQRTRQHVLSEFTKAYKASRFTMISNCAVFTEGVDVPELDTVVFVDNKTSKISIVQAVGRAVRLNKKNPNKIANVVIPVFIDDDEDPEEQINGTRFRTLYSIITALRESDNMEAMYAKAFLREEQRELGIVDEDSDSDMINAMDADGNLITGMAKAPITVIAPESHGAALDMGSIVKASYSNIVAACEAKVIGVSGSVFERNLGKLKLFKKINGGKCDVISMDATVGTFSIGKAMFRVREEFNAGMLPEHEQKAYEEVGFLFRKPKELAARLIEAAAAHKVKAML